MDVEKEIADEEFEKSLKSFFSYPDWSPELAVARRNHLIGCGDLRRISFADKKFESWCCIVQEIINNENIHELREKLLSNEEIIKIRLEEEEGF